MNPFLLESCTFAEDLWGARLCDGLVLFSGHLTSERLFSVERCFRLTSDGLCQEISQTLWEITTCCDAHVSPHTNRKPWACWYLNTLAVKKSDFRALNATERRPITFQVVWRLLPFPPPKKKFHGPFSRWICKNTSRKFRKRSRWHARWREITPQRSVVRFFNWS